jgi:hypothetical protein
MIPPATETVATTNAALIFHVPFTGRANTRASGCREGVVTSEMLDSWTGVSQKRSPLIQSGRSALSSGPAVVCAPWSRCESISARFVNPLRLKVLAYPVAFAIASFNAWLLVQTFSAWMS